MYSDVPLVCKGNVDAVEAPTEDSWAIPSTNTLYWIAIAFSRYRGIRESWAIKHWIHDCEELSSLGWLCHSNGWQSPA